ncbi:unnamed protein product, partial [Prorocentrum cordatum]
VGESLTLGSSPSDWCWDYERGFIRVLGGELDEPNFLSKGEGAQLTAVDIAMKRWFKREAARIMGMSLEEVAKDRRTSCETCLRRMRRLCAEQRASRLLEEGRTVSDGDVLEVLRLWDFENNTSRTNVMPEGVDSVASETLGLVRTKIGQLMVPRRTADYPGFVSILAKYLRDHLPPEVPEFPFTSINVNKDYAAKLHRDGNNVGPSFIKAFGSFSGGDLVYYPNDDRSLKLDELPDWDAVTIRHRHQRELGPLRRQERAHRVSPFEGQRFSVVWFCCPRGHTASEEDREHLRRCGVTLPSLEQERWMARRSP